jgi:putative transposase
MWYYQSTRDDQPVIDKLSKLADQHPTRGFDTYYGPGYQWSRNTVLRVYRLLRLKLRRQHKRRLSSRLKEPLETPISPNYT